MTFFEAAVQVLREAGRPLHFKKITDQAIQRDLLSHVGKTPEDTMASRLSQEAAKGAGESVIEEVRPGVFGLRDGVDTDDAGETIQLRAPADEPEPEPVTDDYEPEEDEAPAAPPAVVRPDDDRRRGRRRSRRSGRKDNDAREDDSDNDDEDDDNDAPRPERRATSKRTSAKSDGRDNNDLGDIATTAVGILGRGNAKSLSASKIAAELAGAKVGALGRLGTTGLRNALTEANQRRAHQGRPPVFEEIKPNFWGLASASGTSLARSYDALDQWQQEHRDALVEAVLQQLVKLDAKSLGTLVTLLLDRLGYTQVSSPDSDGKTLSARSPNRLIPTTVAVRIAPSGETTGRTEVAALRGSLHHYSAAAGVIFAVGRTTSDVDTELSVPNVAPITLLDGEAVAELLIATGVGVARFSVDVSCLDDALFRELRND